MHQPLGMDNAWQQTLACSALLGWCSLMHIRQDPESISEIFYIAMKVIRSSYHSVILTKVADSMMKLSSWGEWSVSGMSTCMGSIGFYSKRKYTSLENMVSLDSCVSAWMIMKLLCYCLSKGLQVWGFHCLMIVREASLWGQLVTTIKMLSPKKL